MLVSSWSVSFAQDRPSRGPVQPSFNYDPAGCSLPVTDGMVTISLGRRVLAWPFDRIIFNSPNNPKRVPAASDPTAPEGCPENPVRGGNYALHIRFRTGTTTDSDNRPKSGTGRDLCRSPVPGKQTGLTEMPHHDPAFALARISSTLVPVIGWYPDLAFA